MTTYTDVDAPQKSISARPLGSSWRHRRLVIGGHVVFDPVALARPSMSTTEISLLTSLFRRAEYALEFGAGGSTTLGIKLGLSRLISVEADAAWIARIRADDAAARAEEDRRLTLVHADIGPIAALGGPKARGPREKWPNYARAPWQHVNADRLDLVVVDGRFRVACIMETALRVSHRSVIAIHDFWNRPEYHAVLEFIDEIDRCETLGVFRVKAGADRAGVQALLAQGLHWPK